MFCGTSNGLKLEFFIHIFVRNVGTETFEVKSRNQMDVVDGRVCGELLGILKSPFRI